jgi:hypothetical protein
VDIMPGKKDIKDTEKFSGIENKELGAKKVNSE